VVGLVDTNCDPDKIDLIIPGNDDAIKSIKLVTALAATAVSEGRNKRVREPDYSAGHVGSYSPQHSYMIVLYVLVLNSEHGGAVAQELLLHSYDS